MSPRSNWRCSGGTWSAGPTPISPRFGGRKGSRKEARGMEMYLETARLILRHFTPDDADNLVMLDGDPEVMRYLNGGAPTPRDFIVRETLPRFFSYYEIGRGYGVWAAIEKETGDFLGRFILRPLRDTAPDEW